MLILISTGLYAQQGYVRTDTTYNEGRIQDKGIFLNNRELKFRVGNKEVTYVPSQVLEYGFVKGDVYIRKTVREANKAELYFLLRLVNGDRNLYLLQEKKVSRFFVEHDSTLVEIRNDISFHEQLKRELKPCGTYQPMSASTHFNRTSLGRAVLLNNRCYGGQFPPLRRGFLMGYESSRLSGISTINHLSVALAGSSFVAGLCIDTPLGKSPYWFFQIAATYQQNNYGGFRVEGPQNQDYQYNFSTISIPVLIKFKGTSSLWRPFLCLGPTPALNRQQVNSFLTTTSSGSIITVKSDALDPVKKFQVSGTLCAGIEYSLTPKKAVSLELRFKKLIDPGVGSSQSMMFAGSFYF